MYNNTIKCIHYDFLQKDQRIRQSVEHVKIVNVNFTDGHARIDDMVDIVHESYGEYSKFI